MLAALGAAVLVLWPLWLGSPALMLLTGLAIPLSLSYSFPLFGRRLKDVPVLKTLFAPLVVLMAVLGAAHPAARTARGRAPPAGRRAGAGRCSCSIWCSAISATSRATAPRARKACPVLLGGEGTQALLWALIGGAVACAAIHGWPILAALTVAALAPLALAAHRPRGEAFYEWLAEGTLFLPALVELGKNLAPPPGGVESSRSSWPIVLLPNSSPRSIKPAS